MDFNINSLLASSAAAYTQSTKDAAGNSTSIPMVKAAPRNETLEALSQTLANAQNKSPLDNALESLVNIDLELSGLERELAAINEMGELELSMIEGLLKRLDEIKAALDKIDAALEKIMSNSKLKDAENKLVESNIEKSALLRSQLEAQRQARENSEKSEPEIPLAQ